MAGRFIKLYDKILQWEWYNDINTFRLFIHLLLKANYKPLRFEGQMIERGQLVTSLPKLSAQTGLSVRQVRVSLDKLKLTGEVTDKTYSKYRVITIVRYDDYQSNDRQNDRQMTGEMAGKRQANDRQMTASIDNIEQIEDIEKEEHTSCVRRTAQRFIPPTYDEIQEYCRETGYWIETSRFLDYYTSKGWKVGRSPMSDWKAAVRNWWKRDGEARPPQSRLVQQRKSSSHNFEEREYSRDEMESDMMRSLADEIRKSKEEGII